MVWGKTLLLVAWTAIVSLFAIHTFAEVSPTTDGGEWLVEGLDGTPNKWHTYKGILDPQYTGNTDGISVRSLQTLTQEREYLVDSQKPIITRIQPPPSVSNLDPDNLRIVYEITDPKGGSGLALFNSNTDESESLSTTVSSPAKYTETKTILFEDGTSKFIYEITSADLIKDEKINVNIVAKDVAGNETRLDETFGYKPNEQLGELLGSNPCEYLQSAYIAVRLEFPNEEKIFYKGDDLKAIYTFYSKEKQVIDNIEFDTKGPASFDESEVDVDIESTQFKNHFRKVFMVKETSASKNNDKISVIYKHPESIRRFYQKPSDGSACPANIYQLPPRRCGESNKCYDLIDGAPVETSFGFPPIVTDERVKLTDDFYVVERVKQPTGEVKYDKRAKELAYEVTVDQNVDLDFNQSFSVLTSNIGRLETVNFEDPQTYKFKYKEVKEGKYQIDAGITAFALFKGAAGEDTSFHHLTDEYTVKQDPPRILNFSYNYQSEKLTIQVSDEGTETYALKGDLTLGGKKYPVSFDSAGNATIDFPQPFNSVDALFSVRDLADQVDARGMQIVGKKVFDLLGNIGEEEQGNNSEPGDPNETLPQNSSGQGLGFKPVGPVVNGKQNFINCKQTCRYIGFGGSSSSSNSNIVCGDANGVGGGYNRSCFTYNPDNQGSAPFTAIPKSAGSSRTCYTKCSEPKLLDRFAPVISNFIVDTNSSDFSADIDDYGGPLDEVRVSYGIYQDLDRKKIKFISDASQTGEYDNQGKVAVNFSNTVDPESEIIEISLGAEDKSKNRAGETKRITTPKSPPNIKFSHVAINDDIGSTLLFAEFQDRSGIDVPLTELSIDGSPCVSQLLSRGSGGFSSLEYFHPYKWVCRAALNEGGHVLSAKGSDNVGLEASGQYPFDINYKPTIRKFFINDVNPEDAGASVFTAEVYDVGNDVSISGFELLIDGQLVPSNQYVYESSTGVFDLIGPLEILEGHHVAKLSVTDSNGNSDSKSLSFGRTADLAITTGSGVADLLLDRISVWELQNSNGDGLINPGELVRLFPSFTNNGAVVLNDLQVKVDIKTIGVNIESPESVISQITPGQTVSLLNGFDLRVDADVLSREGLQEKSIPIEITVTGEESKTWVFESELVIREPRESFRAAAQPVVGGGVNILPSISLSTPVIDEFGFSEFAVIYTGTISAGDSEIVSFRASLDGDPDVDLLNESAPPGGFITPLGGGFGFRNNLNASISGETFTLTIDFTTNGNHVLVVTVETADGDIAIDTDTFVTNVQF